MKSFGKKGKILLCVIAVVIIAGIVVASYFVGKTQCAGQVSCPTNTSGNATTSPTTAAQTDNFLTLTGPHDKDIVMPAKQKIYTSVFQVTEMKNKMLPVLNKASLVKFSCSPTYVSNYEEGSSEKTHEYVLMNDQAGQVWTTDTPMNDREIYAFIESRGPVKIVDGTPDANYIEFISKCETENGRKFFYGLNLLGANYFANYTSKIVDGKSEITLQSEPLVYDPTGIPRDGGFLSAAYCSGIVAVISPYKIVASCGFADTPDSTIERVVSIDMYQGDISNLHECTNTSIAGANGKFLSADTCSF